MTIMMLAIQTMLKMQGVSVDVTGLSARQTDIFASGGQNARNRPGQLVADGLAPADHLAVALGLEHPLHIHECIQASSEESLGGLPAPWACACEI